MKPPKGTFLAKYGFLLQQHECYALENDSSYLRIAVVLHDAHITFNWQFPAQGSCIVPPRQLAQALRKIAYKVQHHGEPPKPRKKT